MHLLSLSELAQALGVSRAAVSNWRRRHPKTFPRPVEHEGRTLFRAEEVMAWLDGRGIARPRSFPGRAMSTTSGDLAHHVNGLGTSDPAVDQLTARWTRLLRSPESQALADTPEVLVALMATRLRDPHAWTTLIENAATDPIEALADFLRARNFPSLALERRAAPAVGLLLTALNNLRPPQDDAGWAMLTDSLLEALSELAPRMKGEYYTPREVVGLMLSTADIKANEEVFDPSCGVGSLLTRAAEVTGDGVRGNALWSQSAAAARAMLALQGISADITEDPDPRPDPLRKFSAILSNPPFARRLNAPRDSRFGRIPAANADFAWLCDAYEQLAPGGRAAILMPNGTTFRLGAERDLRAAMVEAGAVDRIIALPAGLFAPHTGIAVTLWMLRRDTAARDVVMVDGTDLGHRIDGSRRVLSEDDIALLQSTEPRDRVRVVSLEEIRDKDYDLTPARYVTREPVTIADTLTDRLDSLKQAENAAHLADTRAREQLSRIIGGRL
ncbi:N-6 DNA methylase [Streptosporangium amethystogenes]|uniref:N-6 DNA methylase n=1 Tax=Streptosporangium amethystogenes TaxID=2002 RepID=UPI0037936855